MATLKVMSIFLLHQVTNPTSTLWIPASMNFGLAYWYMSIAVNVILTLGIVGSLLATRLRVRRIMGSHHNIPYLTISAMLVESAFLYTAFGLCFLIPLAIKSNVNLIFFQLFMQIQVSICHSRLKN